MDKGLEVLSDITIWSKYAKYLPDEKRRETWDEIVDRYEDMMVNKFPDLTGEIIENAVYIRKKKVLPSMRALQFAGLAMEVNNARGYNCAFHPIESIHSFSETMFLLLGGSGVGYSVQKHHVDKLPAITIPSKKRRYLIQDSIIGWGDAVKALMKAYLQGHALPDFDFRDIRPKGSRLITAGGKAPGPEPLKECLFEIQKVLDRKKDGEKLRPIECHDILCHIANAVLAGGIRRAAMIALFDKEDDEMMTCKFGNWWELNEQRGRSNNSVVLKRGETSKEEFLNIWQKVELSNSGEPGMLWTNDPNFDWGTNPCKPLDATILTPQGYITFAEALEKEELEVITPDGRTVKASKPFMTGVDREVFEITLSNGQVLLGTSNHLHQTIDGKWTAVADLSVGSRLKIGKTKQLDFTINNQQDYEKGLLAGWVLADGWNFDRAGKNSKRTGLCFGENEGDVVELFEKITGNTSYLHYQKPETCTLLRVNQTEYKQENKFDLPFTASQDYKLGFIRAVFTADGSVRKDNNVELYSIKKEVLQGIGLILQEFGIRSTICVHNNAKSYVSTDGKMRNNKICYKLNVFAGQFKKIGFLSKIKQDLLDKQQEKLLYRRKDYETVVSIKSRGKEDVYDITVYDECHSFIDMGIITHNCAEIGLRPYQFCNL